MAVCAAAGDPAENLLGITAVHPMREEAVRELLEREKAGWEVVVQLLQDGKLLAEQYAGHTYYLRRPPAPA